MYRRTAQGLASLGRNGDTMLMHVSPDEVAGLQALGQQHGKSLTINPHTGMPEAFDFKSFLPMLAGLALSPFTGGMSMGMAMALEAGAGAAVGAATHQNPWLSALGGLGGAGLGSSLIGAGANAAGSGAAAAGANAAADTAVTGATGASDFLAAADASGNLGGLGASAAGDMGGAGVLADTAGVADAGAASTAATTGNMGLTASGVPESIAAGTSSTVPSAVPLSEQWSQGMTQMGRGVGNLNRDQALRAEFMKTLPAGRLTLAAAAAPALKSAMDAPKAAAINTKPRGYYNTRWDPNKHAYVDPRTGSPVTQGYWTKDYLDAGRAGAAGAGQDNANIGTYDNPYADTITAREGGQIGHYDEGGQVDMQLQMMQRRQQIMDAQRQAPVNMGAARQHSMGTLSPAVIANSPALRSAPIGMASGGTAPAADTSGLRSYYQSLLAAPQPAATAPANDAMNSWLTNMQGTPTAAVAPPQPKVTPPDPLPSDTTGGITSHLGSGYTGTGVIQNHTFVWDPVTQTYSQPGGGASDSKGIYHAAQGGLASLSDASFSGGKYLRGPGDGMSDSIRANIDGQQDARLARNEFVIPADVVSHLGNGSSEAGAEMLYGMMDRVRQARTGKKSQAPEINSGKYMLA